jgi:hypothetical protein
MQAKSGLLKNRGDHFHFWPKPMKDIFKSPHFHFWIAFSTPKLVWLSADSTFVPRFANGGVSAWRNLSSQGAFGATGVVTFSMG